MRIITGSLKGRRLKSPKTNDVRPTSDKVKEAMFDMLYPYIQDEFVCMDVFAGSGNLGLEAISRGAKRVYFSDSSRDSLSLVKENVKYCGVEDKIGFSMFAPRADKVVGEGVALIDVATGLAHPAGFPALFF